jgi:hypothetical protein
MICAAESARFWSSFGGFDVCNGYQSFRHLTSKKDPMELKPLKEEVRILQADKSSHTRISYTVYQNQGFMILYVRIPKIS